MMMTSNSRSWGSTVAPVAAASSRFVGSVSTVPSGKITIGSGFPLPDSVTRALPSGESAR